MLKPGDKAPDFTLTSDEGKEISLSDFKGKRVLIFFFPKANTPG
jgi:thioredoxin-dependent peroxiredoxin